MHRWVSRGSHFPTVMSEMLGGLGLGLPDHPIPAIRRGSKAYSTCCHDDSCQDFPSRMRGCEVVRQLAKLVHHQAGDCVSENLRHQAVMMINGKLH